MIGVVSFRELRKEAEVKNATMPNVILKSAQIETPLGGMLAVADEEKLYLLEFADHKKLKKKLEHLEIYSHSAITPGETRILDSIKQELDLYFAGKLQNFSTPTHIEGSEFQSLIWHTLKEIPYGETISYSQLAANINRPLARRAAANANSANRFSIIVPCHRVVGSGGKLGGYGGGVPRKRWLIAHERTFHPGRG